MNSIAVFLLLGCMSQTINQTRIDYTKKRPMQRYLFSTPLSNVGQNKNYSGMLALKYLFIGICIERDKIWKPFLQMDYAVSSVPN